MKLGFIRDQTFRNLRRNGHVIRYVATQLAAKAMAAVAQLYAIYVFSRILSPNDAALVFIIFGYGIWIQVFEFGLSQVIQNALNSKAITFVGACRIISLHYAIMGFIAVLIVMFPKILGFLLGDRFAHWEGLNVLAFSFGIALLLVSTNNVLVQRFLLVINRAMVASKLIFLQSMFSVLVLLTLQWRGATFFESVSVYLLIPIITFSLLTLKITRKAFKIPNKVTINWRFIISNAAGFWGLTALSSVYLGADYFFAARYLENAEMIAYHFSSRLFFISYVAYFSYVQFKAKSIAAEVHLKYSRRIWIVAREAVAIGVISVALLLLFAIGIEWSGALDMIGASGFVVTPLILLAAIYYGARVFRDVGLVLIWNLGRQRLLYAVHAAEVFLCLLLLKAFAPVYGGKGIFAAMAIVSVFSTVVLYAALRRISLSPSYVNTEPRPDAV